jgi:hypothetical protein
MAGKLYDVWYESYGRAHSRRKLAVTLDPKLWCGPMGRAKLDSIVREEFSDLSKALDAQIRITNRPDLKTVHLVKWIE